MSCDPGSTIKYEIVNNTTDNIKVKYQFVFDTSHSEKEVDILAKASKTIHIDNPLGYAKQYNDSHDSIFLYSLTIQQNNKLTKQNFKDKKYWKFYETDSDNLNGTYKLIIDSTYFINQ